MDLPGHLQPLMEHLAEDLSMHEHEELAVAIFRYKDVYATSSGLTDMGKAD